MGGTFDPIHTGHLGMARTVFERLELDEMRFIPTGRPHFKLDRPVTDPRMRAEMVAIAIANDPGFVLDCREVDREGVTYTIDTLRDLHDEFPDAEIFFAMGADSAKTLPGWKAARAIAELATIVVCPRPGSDFTSVRKKLLYGDIDFRLLEVAAPPVDISSTQVRERLRAGEDVSDVVPADVLAYIEEHDLYRA